MPTLADAKKSAEFLTKTTGDPHYVVDANREGSTDKFLSVSLTKMNEKGIKPTDKRVVFTVPVEEKAPAATAAKAAANPAAKAPAAAKTLAAKAPTVSGKTTAVVDPEFIMVSVEIKQHDWLLEHGLTVRQGLIIAQKYHASIERQAPGTADAKLQELTAPKETK